MNDKTAFKNHGEELQPFDVHLNDGDIVGKGFLKIVIIEVVKKKVLGSEVRAMFPYSDWICRQGSFSLTNS